VEVVAVSEVVLAGLVVVVLAGLFVVVAGSVGAFFAGLVLWSGVRCAA
jgi:hypothetical protein